MRISDDEEPTYTCANCHWKTDGKRRNTYTCDKEKQTYDRDGNEIEKKEYDADHTCSGWRK